MKQSIAGIGEYLSATPDVTMKVMDESALVELYRSGDAEAFGELYEAYTGKIYKYLFYRTLNRSLAEDLTSETFVKALKHIGSFDARKGTFSSWIYRIARNTLFDYFRTEKKTLDISELEIRSDTDLRRDTEAKEMLSEALKYLEGLTQEQRDIVLMRLWDEMSFKEISAVIGKSEKACQMSFSRIIAAMRKEVLVGLLFTLMGRNLIT